MLFSGFSRQLTFDYNWGEAPTVGSVPPQKFLVVKITKLFKIYFNCHSIYSRHVLFRLNKICHPKPYNISTHII